MSTPRELAPGILHWTAYHQGIRSDVSSYYLVDERVLLDPMPPEGGFAALAEAHGAPQAVLLTNRHHYRHAGEVAETWGVRVHVHEAGMHEFTRGEPVEPYRFGDTLPGGVVAQELDAICPDETALWVPRARALAFADGLVRFTPDAPLGFVPDTLMGDDPKAVRAGLVAGLRRLLELDPEHLLLAHGAPVAGDGRQALAEAIEREAARL